MPANYTLAEIRETVATNLGSSGVNLEIGEKDFKRGVDAALKMLAKFYPQYGYQVVTTSRGGNKFKLSADNVIGVLDCTWFQGGSRFEEAPYYTRWSDRMLELGDMKDTQRIFGDKPEFEWMFETDPLTGDKSCWVYTHSTISSFVDTFARLPSHISVQFAWYIEASDHPVVGVRQIAYDMRQWVEDFATAKCRVILGEIRNKFGGIPGSTDESVMPGDGLQQIQRGEQAIRDLTEDLRMRRRQSPLQFD